MIRVRRLRTRVILFSGALLAVVALTGLLLVNSASARFATAKTESEESDGRLIPVQTFISIYPFARESLVHFYTNRSEK